MRSASIQYTVMVVIEEAGNKDWACDVSVNRYLYGRVCVCMYMCIYACMYVGMCLSVCRTDRQPLRP